MARLDWRRDTMTASRFVFCWQGIKALSIPLEPMPYGTSFDVFPEFQCGSEKHSRLGTYNRTRRLDMLTTWAHGCCQGLRARDAGAKMLFELPIRLGLAFPAVLMAC